MAYGVILGQTNDSFPIGGIIIWSGQANAIPQNWQLCDGTNGTPDLRNRFVVGAGENYQVGNVGGSDNVKLNISQMPTHTHNNDFQISLSDLSLSVYKPSNYPGNYTKLPVAENTSGRDGSWETLSSNMVKISATGELSGSIANTGGNQPHENRPPYYALCYIMRVK